MVRDMPPSRPPPDDDQPTPIRSLSPSDQVGLAAEELRGLEELLEVGRAGASEEWVRAAQDAVDDAWIRWRRAAGDVSKLD